MNFTGPAGKREATFAKFFDCFKSYGWWNPQPCPENGLSVFLKSSLLDLKQYE